MGAGKAIVQAISEGNLIGAKKAINDAILATIGAQIEARRPLVAEALFTEAKKCDSDEDDKVPSKKKANARLKGAREPGINTEEVQELPEGSPSGNPQHRWINQKKSKANLAKLKQKVRAQGGNVLTINSNGSTLYRVVKRKTR